MPPLKTLPVFTTVAKLLSFTKAAEELCLTHSAVSQAIKQLETYLQCQLFERSTSHVCLTKTGERYLASILPALQQISSATGEIKYSAKWLKVNLMNSLALHWLIPAMPAFSHHYPKVKINLSTSATPLYSALDTDEIDVVITARKTPIKSEQKHAIPLWQDELVLVASPKLIASQKQSMSLAKYIKKLPRIYVDTKIRSKDWQTWCKGMGIATPARSQGINFSTTSQALQATVSGLGLFVTHHIYVKDNIKLGLLQLVDSAIVKNGETYYLVVLKDKMNEDSVQQFIRFTQKMSIISHNK